MNKILLISTTLLAISFLQCSPSPHDPAQDMNSPEVLDASPDLVDQHTTPDLPTTPDLDQADATADLSSSPADMPDEVSLSAHAGESVYAFVNEPVTLDGSASTGATSYQWSPGSNLDPLPPSSSPTTTYTYDTPGRYRVVLTAIDDSGKKRTDSKIISVTYKPKNTPNTSSSIAVIPSENSSQDTIAILNEDAKSVSIIHRDHDTFTLTKRLHTTGSPRQITHLQDWLVVSTRAPAQLELFSLSDTSIHHTIALPPHSRPHGLITIDDTLHVALQGTGSIQSITLDPITATPQDVRTAFITPDIRSLSLLPNGQMLATQWRATHHVARIVTVDPSTLNVTNTWTLPVDTRPSSDTESSGVPNYLDHPALSPTEDRIMIPSTQANMVEGLFLNNVDPEHDTVLRAVVSEINPSTGETSVEQRIQFDGRGLASAALFSPRGDYLYVAMRGSRTIEIIDILDGGADAGTLFEVGHTPDALALSSDGKYLIVNASLSRESVIYNTTTLARQPIPDIRLSLVDEEPLSPELLLGKQLFNNSFDRRLTADGYVACAHCHMEGESDHIVWDFTDRGEGLRNTTSLTGRGGAAHGPIHWSGNFDEPQDFEHDIREHFGGTGFLTDEQYAMSTSLGSQKAGLNSDLDALAAYMTSLDTFPQSPYQSTPAQLSRGQAIFESSEAQCATCHQGERLTDSQFLTPGSPLLHDVGTLKPSSGARLGDTLDGIDTPTLHELWNSAPYLHDGSALSLLDVLTTHNPLDQHGKTSHLTPEQIDDLIAYLLSL